MERTGDPIVKNLARNKAGLTAGFTLIELVITVAIIAFLASIAFPVYTDQIRKSKRADLVTDIMECAAVMERRFTIFNTYQDTACNNIANDDYSLAVTVSCDSNGKKNCYSIVATPASTFAIDDTACASFTMDHLGSRSATGSGSDPTKRCWNT